VKAALEAQKAREAEKEAQLASLREKVISSQRASPAVRSETGESKNEAEETSNEAADVAAHLTSAAPTAASPPEPGETLPPKEDIEMAVVKAEVNGKVAEVTLPAQNGTDEVCIFTSLTTQRRQYLHECSLPGIPF
jgi:hypothetical protein